MGFKSYRARGRSALLCVGADLPNHNVAVALLAISEIPLHYYKTHAFNGRLVCSCKNIGSAGPFDLCLIRWCR